MAVREMATTRWMGLMTMHLGDGINVAVMSMGMTKGRWQAQDDGDAGSRRIQVQPRSAGDPCGSATGENASGAT